MTIFAVNKNIISNIEKNNKLTRLTKGYEKKMGINNMYVI